MRDVDEYKSYALPVYARGITQQSIRGRSSCAGHGIEVLLGSVTVRPGDLVLGDDNGVCVVPRDRVPEVLEFARLVKATEDRVIAEIRAGTDPIVAHERVKYDRLLSAK
jgi:regulator of RNase E activity RraA